MSEHHLGEDLAAMAEGGTELSEERRTELSAHIEGCEACTAAIAEVQAVFAAFDTPALEPSSDFDKATFAKLDHVDRELAREERADFFQRLKAFFTMPRLAVGVAAAAAAAIMFAVYAPQTPNPSKPTHELTQGDALRVVAQNTEVLENLDVLEDLELYDNLDVLYDLDVIEEMDEVEG